MADPLGDLPPHVGGPRSASTAYMLTCAYTGATAFGPECGGDAVGHLLFVGKAGERFSVPACAEHAPMAVHFGAVDGHPTVGAACCMPGAIWVDGPPSTCVLDDSGQEPALAGVRSSGVYEDADPGMPVLEDSRA